MSLIIDNTAVTCNDDEDSDDSDIKVQWDKDMMGKEDMDDQEDSINDRFDNEEKHYINDQMQNIVPPACEFCYSDSGVHEQKDAKMQNDNNIETISRWITIITI